MWSFIISPLTCTCIQLMIDNSLSYKGIYITYCLSPCVSLRDHVAIFSIIISYIVLLWWLFTLTFHLHLIISFLSLFSRVHIYMYSIIICLFHNLLIICVLLMYVYLIVHNLWDDYNVHGIPYMIYFFQIIFHLSQII